MQNLMYVFPIILGTVIILGVTTTVVRRILKSSGNKLLAALVVLTGAVSVWGLVKVVYQPYGLYERHIKTATGFDLGPDTEFVFADTWIGSDETGKFSSVMVIELSNEERDKLKAALLEQNYIKNDAQVKQHTYLQSKIQPMLMLETVKEVVEDYVLWEDNPTSLGELTVKYYFAFLNDDATVIAYVWNK